MDEQATLVAKPPSDGSTTASSGFRALDSESQRKASRNLAAVAGIYAAVYLAAFATGFLLHLSEVREWHLPRLLDLITAFIAIGVSLLVARTCWECAAPKTSFTRTAQIYAIFAALGISMTYWGWEGDVLLPGGGAMVGVSWVGVWILMFPAIVALDPGRVLRTSLLSAVTVPAVAFTSLAVHGIPEGAATGAAREAPIVVARLTVPVLICAGIAYVTARHVFGLTRDVSRARQMGSYRLVEKLGVGGMGEVWRAEHRLLARPAAIKLIRHDVLDPRQADDTTARTVLRRFEREAQSTALLTSPHTIELYDFGVTDEGTFYYVMELLQGLDLRTLVERDGPIPPARAVRFLRQACHSLADAHRAGMIHRDVKPANLFTCRRGLEYDFVKVLDFGLVKETGITDGDAQLTMEGVASGTPAFMAPEMALSRSEIDGRADIYALGCVGYWLLTGKLVFEGENGMAMAVRHVNDEPTPPSAHSEHEIDPELESIVLDCLAKDPEDRPQSAQELAARLTEVERRVGDWTESRAERWWRTHLPQYVATATFPTSSASPVETS